MTRLIDADALCMHLSDWQFGEMTDGKHNAQYEVIDKVIDGIEQEPTVDAVAVIRCKDCAKRGTINCDLDYCGYRKADNWFCADGERCDE